MTCCWGKLIMLLIKDDYPKLLQKWFSGSFLNPHLNWRKCTKLHVLCIMGLKETTLWSLLWINCYFTSSTVALPPWLNSVLMMCRKCLVTKYCISCHQLCLGMFHWYLMAAVIDRWRNTGHPAIHGCLFSSNIHGTGCFCVVYLKYIPFYVWKLPVWNWICNSNPWECPKDIYELYLMFSSVFNLQYSAVCS